jgi:protein ImuA
LRTRPPPQQPNRAEVVGELRRMLTRMEGIPKEAATRLSFGIPALDTHLPEGGLAFGAVHEIAPETEAYFPAAFGFLVSLISLTPGSSPLLLVRSSRKLARCGTLYGNGLMDLGLDPARLIFIESANEAEALWATEEAVRSRGPAAVASVLGGKLDLKASQRLSHATRDANVPLFLLRPENMPTVPTAATRWRIGRAPGVRDRFGLLSGWRWRAALERCRNGRPGKWMLEFDHATHRFGLAAAMADSSLAHDGEAPAFERAG